MNVANELVTVLNPPRCFAPILSPAIFRAQCEDFEVEEIPTYLPGGDGEHLFLWIQKRDISTSEVVSQLARRLGISSRDIGVAGQKDRRAVTRQFVSVPFSCELRLKEVEDLRFKILSVEAHNNKLRTGHLQGNRFRIVLRPSEVDSYSDTDADTVMERLLHFERHGFPGYFGGQRFGHEGRTAIEGLGFIKGELKANHWKHQQRRFMTKMVASAIQSAVFNCTLAERMAVGSWAVPGSGDIVCSRQGQRPFLFDDRGDLAAEELIPMGPMPGPKMMAATGAVLDMENSVLGRFGLSQEDFTRYRKLTSGTRRRNVDFPRNTSAQKLPDGTIEIGFDLSAGSFATVLLAEITELRLTTRDS